MATKENVEARTELVTLTRGSGKNKESIKVTKGQIEAGWGAGDEKWGKAVEKVLAEIDNEGGVQPPVESEEAAEAESEAADADEAAGQAATEGKDQ